MKEPMLFKRAVEAELEALHEFGYSDVTAATIEAAHVNWKAGKEPLDIIERFAFGHFDGFPNLFGTRDKGDA